MNQQNTQVDLFPDISVREIAYAIDISRKKYVGNTQKKTATSIEETFRSDDDKEESGMWDAIEQITVTVNLSVNQILDLQSHPFKRKKAKPYYIRKSPLPRILKRDFRRDFVTMFRNAVNSGDPLMIEQFFVAFAVPELHAISHNPVLKHIGCPVIQHYQGRESVIREATHRSTRHSDTAIFIKDTKIIQKVGIPGSKIVSAMNFKASQVVMPQLGSLMKLESFFCNCNFIDCQKLMMIKTMVAMRSRFANTRMFSYESDPKAPSTTTATTTQPSSSAPLQEQVTQVIGNTIDYAMRQIPAWMDSTREQVFQTIGNCLIDHPYVPTNSISANLQTMKNQIVDTVCFMDVELLVQQMQLFYTNFKKDNDVDTADVLSSSSSSSPSSVTSAISVDEDARKEDTEHKEEEGRGKQARKRKVSNNGIQNNTTMTAPPRKHFLTMNKKPLFESCTICGRSKIPHAKVLQALSNPFLIQISVYPFMSFYFNEQNQLYRIELMVPMDEQAYSIEFPTY